MLLHCVASVSLCFVIPQFPMYVRHIGDTGTKSTCDEPSSAMAEGFQADVTLNLLSVHVLNRWGSVGVDLRPARDESVSVHKLMQCLRNVSVL